MFTTLENLENSGNFLILENSGSFKFTGEIIVSVVLFFVINLAPASAVLAIKSTQQNFGHFVER